MLQLAKLVRFWFGLQAIALVVALPLFGYAMIRMYVQHDARFTSHPAVWFRLGYVCASSAFAATAWWTLRNEKRTARRWALVASVVNLADFGFLTIVGLAGLAAFARTGTAAALTKSARGNTSAAAPPVKGDGTHPWFEKLAPFISFAWLMIANALWAIWGMHHGLSRTTGLLSWLQFGLAIHVSVLFHELGHLLVGWSSDMVFRAFTYGPVGGVIRAGRWRWTVNLAGLLGSGMVGMVPRHLKNVRGRMVLLILGGPVASLFAGSIAIVMALTAPGHSWAWTWQFWALTGSMCFADFVVNLVPLRPEGQYSDGAQIYQLMRQGGWADVHLAMAMVGSSLATPLRPREFDCVTLERAANFLPCGERGVYMRIFLAMHHLDSGRMHEATLAWRSATTLEAAQGLTADVAAEFVFFEAAIAGDLDRARAWWARVESKGGSKREVDYWKGRAALLLLENKLDEAHAACEQGDRFADALPSAGAYQFDRWCLALIREKLELTHQSQVRVVRYDSQPTPLVEPVLAAV